MMIRGGIALIALLATAAAATPLPVPPAAVTGQRLLIWTPGEVRCAGVPVGIAALVRPRPALGWQNAQSPTTMDIRFRIDESGRPLSIDRSDTLYRVGSEDIVPSLAATRFASGTARSDCTIQYSVQATVPTESAPADLLTYSVDPQNGQLPAPAWRRIQQAGSDCLTVPRPAPLLRAYPDYARIPATPGVRDWSMVDFDLDKHGRPIHTRIALGTGNAALDVAATKAVRASRFTGGARTGCQYPYWRKAGTLAAPPHPEAATLRPADSNCPKGDTWATYPPLIYPPAFSRRSIEGWAVIAFDVAPWGQTGNLRVLASEPAAAFGEQAMDMLRQARKAVSPSGRSGCVEMVKFVIKDGAVTNDITFPS